MSVCLQVTARRCVRTLHSELKSVSLVSSFPLSCVSFFFFFSFSFLSLHHGVRDKQPISTDAYTWIQVASIGIHLRHRISSHGFAINITPEPVNWFDLVVACGLTDMKAVSAQTLLERAGARADSNGKERLSVRMAARDIASLFERAYGRKVIPLLGADSGLGVTGEGSRAQEQGEGEEAEVHEIRKLVTDAEDEARKINEKNGGWRTEPDMQKDIP